MQGLENVGIGHPLRSGSWNQLEKLQPNDYEYLQRGSEQGLVVAHYN
jgi:hypothetical protein